MAYYLIKIGVSALLVVLISELAKRNTMLGALLASLPIVSLLAFIWIYQETGDVIRIASLSTSIFWLVIPSLALFLLLPALLKQGLGFWPSMALSATATVLCYLGTAWALRRMGISL